MKKVILALSMSAGLLAIAPSYASSLSDCLVDSLSLKDRKGITRWTYFSIAAHPDFRPYANITQSDRLHSDQEIASLMTRLLTKDCADLFFQDMQVDPRSVNKAFEKMGKVAMQDLLHSKEVISAMSDYFQHMDIPKATSATGRRLR